MLGLIAYVLFWPDVMTASDRWPSLLVGVQCLLLVGSLGRFTSPAFSFLYSRGYSRDTLWNHTMLASLLSVLVAWLPATLIVWSGLRSAVHDHLFQSPNFPIMAPCEIWVPLVWLGIFVLLTPAFHYAWIRRAQPTKGGFGGFVLSFGIVVALLMSFNIAFYFYFWWLAWLAGVLFVLAVVFLVLGGRALHRSMEVRA
jgi:hypothetical protein